MQEMFDGLRSGLLIAVVVILLAAGGEFPIVAAFASVVVPQCRPSSPASRSRSGSRARRSTFNRSWARSWRSAWPWRTRSCSSPSPSAAGSQGREPWEAAIEGARSRLRPILMTSFAMIAGMIPMAIGLGEGGEQTRAARPGGDRRAYRRDCATLVVLPAIFGHAPAATRPASPRRSIRTTRTALISSHARCPLRCQIPATDARNGMTKRRLNGPRTRTELECHT